MNPNNHLLVSNSTKESLSSRLNRIEGQIKGIQKMVLDGRSYNDILLQVSASKAALHSLSVLLVQHYVQSCVAEAVESGKSEDAVRELLVLLKKMS